MTVDEPTEIVAVDDDTETGEPADALETLNRSELLKMAEKLGIELVTLAADGLAVPAYFTLGGGHQAAQGPHQRSLTAAIVSVQVKQLTRAELEGDAAEELPIAPGTLQIGHFQHEVVCGKENWPEVYNKGLT